MGRILAVDYGAKRVGIAVTDPLKMIASPLDTIESSKVLGFLKDYVSKEDVERIIVGMPKNLQNQDTDSTGLVVKFISQLENTISIPIETIDERFTSKMAFQSMIDGGLKKKDRQNKATIDRLSATIILQSYLESNPSF